MKKLVKNSELYFAQNDNMIWGNVDGYVQCCPTANALLAAIVRNDIYNTVMNSGLYVEFECHYKEQMEACGYDFRDRGNHDAHTVTLREKYGISTYWETNGTIAQIKNCIDNDFPVVLAVDYKESGHVLTIVGYDDEGLIIHDSYGLRFGSTDFYDVINPGWKETFGKYDHYSWSLLQKIAKPLWIRLPV